ncbi:hypothetical protein [Seleniivibrio sp.]|uniref:hypothetical protein n=1 Tax=Seleniivibrio sp. TaxID=2898801 RepID=UPI0025FB4FB8|nr:hypothetical protein [Seleniivibrio sp.]MCD8553082.1 hypothetical protein [Seleniivibrio sp.]
MKGFNYLYPAILAALVAGHVMTLVGAFVFSHFDFSLVIFLLIYEMIDEDNYIWLSVLFGVYTDYARNGFFGPGIMLFLLFSITRFKADIVMDMTKFNSKVLLFTGISLIYCVFNAALSGYDTETVVRMSLIRTVINVLSAIGIAKFMEYRSAFKNA